MRAEQRRTGLHRLPWSLDPTVDHRAAARRSGPGRSRVPDVPRRPASSLAVTTAAVTVTTVGVLPVYLVSVLSVQVRADLGFGPATLGLLAAGFFGTSALTSFVAGPAASRFGSVVVVRGAACTSALSMLLIGGLARSLPVLVLALVLGGCANGLGQPASNSMISTAVTERRQGLAFGVKQAAIPASTLLGGLAVPLIAIPFGWRTAFTLAGALAVLVGVGVPRQAAAASTPRAPSVAAGPFRRVPLLVLSAGLLLAAGSGNALGAFFVASTVAGGVAPGDAGLLAAVASAGGVATRVLLGWLADRMQARWLLVVAAQMGVGAIGYLMLSTSRPVLMAAGGLLAYCSGWAWAGLATYAVSRMHHGMTARATGYTQAGLGLGSALGPLAFGAAVAATSYQTAWHATAALTLVASLVCLLGRHLLLKDRPALVEAHRSRRRSAISARRSRRET
jgi:MFS family permease